MLYPNTNLENGIYLQTQDLNGTERYLWNFTESDPMTQITEQVNNIKRLYIGGSELGLIKSKAWNKSSNKYNTLNAINTYLGADTVDWTEDSSGGDFELGMLIDFTKLNRRDTEQVLASKYRCDNLEYKSWFISHMASENLTSFVLFYNNQNCYETLKIFGLSKISGVNLINFTYEKSQHRLRVYLNSILIAEKDNLNLGSRNNNQNARFLLGALADTGSSQICFADTSFDTVYFQNHVDSENERQVKSSKLLGYTYENNIIPVSGYKKLTQSDLDNLANSTNAESAYYWYFNGTENRINYAYNGEILANNGVVPTPLTIMPISDLKQGRTLNGELGYNFLNGQQALKNQNSNIIYYTGSRLFGFWCRHFDDAPIYDECFLSIYKYNTFAKKLIYFMQDSTTNKLVLCIWYDAYNHTEELWIDNPMLDGKPHFIGGGYSLEDKTMFIIIDDNIYTKYSVNLWKINTAIVGTDAAMTIGTYYREDGQTLELPDHLFLDSMIMIQKPFRMADVLGILNIIK